MNSLQSVAHFSEISQLGPTPLIIPLLLAGLAAWLSQRRRTGALVVVALLLLVFALVTGFSIGAAYGPAVVLVLAASVVSFVSSSMAR